jgi:hypothetical protein
MKIRYELFKEYARMAAYAKFQEETPLLHYKMTREVTKYAFLRNDKSLREAVAVSLRSIVIFIVVVTLVVGLFAYLMAPNQWDVVANAVVSTLGVLLFCMIFLLGNLFTSIKEDSEVIVSLTGVYFLGEFYPFKTQDFFLTAAVFSDAQGQDPALLKLTIEKKQPFLFDLISSLLIRSSFTLDIPLRPDMVEQANTIIKIFLPE